MKCYFFENFISNNIEYIAIAHVTLGLPVFEKPLNFFHIINDLTEALPHVSMIILFLNISDITCLVSK